MMPALKSGGMLLLLFLFTAIGFFIPVTVASWLAGTIRGILFFLITLILFWEYWQKKQLADAEPEAEPEESASDSTRDQLIQAPFHDEASLSPSEGFKWFYHELLDLLKNTLAASCAAVYIQKRDALMLLGGISGNKRLYRASAVAEGDLIDTVVRQRKVISEGNLPIGMTLSGFDEENIRSFLGVPLLWGDTLVGVLAFGADVTESFGEEDKSFALRFGRLLTHAMALFHLGQQWESSDSVSRIHLQLEKKLRLCDDVNQAAVFFAEAVKPLFPFDRFALCRRDGEEGVVAAVVGQIDDIDRGFRFPLNEGINGWVIKRRTPLMLADMKSGDFKRPRYTRSENTKHGMRSYIGIPIGHGEEAWGCICLEHAYANKYQDQNKSMLYTLSFALEATLERLAGQSVKSSSHRGSDAKEQFTLEI